ncbi:unnamed protein product [Durusdinium trenchii]|uniref:Uncharacterized protein n=2 Tax=Durusdinium trenchii TaxID=1381693 RepID=A0ABP0SBD2_9DINO
MKSVPQGLLPTLPLSPKPDKRRPGWILPARDAERCPNPRCEGGRCANPTNAEQVDEESSSANSPLMPAASSSKDTVKKVHFQVDGHDGPCNVALRCHATDPRADVRSLTLAELAKRKKQNIDPSGKSWPSFPWKEEIEMR